jgi:hypothetical protein
MIIQNNKTKEGTMKWLAYCRECNGMVEHCGELVCWENGSMVEAAAKIHAEETGHHIIVGYEIIPKHEAAKLNKEV